MGWCNTGLSSDSGRETSGDGGRGVSGDGGRETSGDGGSGDDWRRKSRPFGKDSRGYKSPGNRNAFLFCHFALEFLGSLCVYMYVCRRGIKGILSTMAIMELRGTCDNIMWLHACSQF